MHHGRWQDHKDHDVLGSYIKEPSIFTLLLSTLEKS